MLAFQTSPSFPNDRSLSPSSPAILTWNAKPLLLNGQWERYEGAYTDEGIESSGIAPVYIDAEARRGFPSVKTDSGSVTYRARINLKGDRGYPQRLALLLLGAAGIDAVYVNGSPLFDRSVDARVPCPMSFDTPDDELSIVLQCGPGGRRLEESSLVPPQLVLGKAEDIGTLLFAWSILLAAAVVFFLLMGVVVLCLFFFWNKTKELLSYSAAMLISGLYLCLEGGFLFGFPPAVITNTAGLESIFLAALIGIFIAFIAFFRSALRDKIPAAAAVALCCVLAALAVAALIMPSLSKVVAMICTAALILVFFGILMISVLLARRSQIRGYVIFGALLVLAAGVGISQVAPASFAATYLSIPAVLAVLGFTFLILLLKKAGNTLDTVESLTDYVTSISKTVKSFIPKEFLEHLDKTDITDLKLGDHARKKMTIFFSDIRSFTELSEKLSVEENFAFINSYLSRVVPVIREHGGFVDKYVGDAIMALFGGKNGPDRAIQSAIAMNAKMVEYNSHRAKVGYRPISVGVGVHTGDLMLGVVGVSDRMENTVISDAVNLGSRLQAITKAFNIPLAISEQAFKELDDPGIYKYRFIGKVKVRGKAEPISVFEIFDGVAPELFDRKMKANTFFEQGMLAYYQKDFSDAMYYFKKVLEILPEDGASTFYFENCMTKAAG
jgi:two-component system sensor histidine kinase ChiS